MWVYVFLCVCMFVLQYVFMYVCVGLHMKWMRFGDYLLVMCLRTSLTGVKLWARWSWERWDIRVTRVPSEKPKSRCSFRNKVNRFSVLLNVEIAPGAQTASCRIGNGGPLAGSKVRSEVWPSAGVRIHAALPGQGVLFFRLSDRSALL